MKISIVTVALFSAVAGLAACGSDDPDIDAEACEHLEGGPYTQVTASAARDAAAPTVSASHMAYTTALTAGAVGYVAFPVQEATDYVIFLDKPVPLAVYDAAGTQIEVEDAATSSAACEAIRGRHTVPLAVGTAYLGLGPNSGNPVNLVIEEASGHEH